MSEVASSGKIKQFDMHSLEIKGRNLIEASAGTGKTFAIANLYLRLVVEKNLPVDKILVVTFTVSATDELKSRIRKKLKYALDYITGKCEPDENELDVNSLLSSFRESPDEKMRIILQSAVKTFDEASIYTIDSLCRQMIVDHAFESGSLQSIEISNDQKAEITSIVLDFWRRRVYGADPFFISIIFDSKTLPDILEQLYDKRPLDPESLILPAREDMDYERLKQVCAAIEKDYPRMKALWLEQRVLVSAILKDDENLDRKKYQKRSMDKKIEEMDRYLLEGNAFRFPESSPFFTDSKIEASTKKGCESPGNVFFSSWEKFASMHPDFEELRDILIVNFKHDLFDYADMRIQEGKSSSNIRTFSDILKDAHHAVTGSWGGGFIKAISERYSAALIDEFQDTDRLQFEIFSRIFQGDDIPLFLIGDPKQAIYKFRGADIFSYIEASNSIVRKYTLDRNWRSRPELIESVNHIFSGSNNPFMNSDIKFNEVLPGEKDQPAFWYGNERRSSLDIVFPEQNISGEDLTKDILEGECFSFIIEKIKDIHEGDYYIGETESDRRPIEFGDIAVLVRSNDQADKIHNMLADVNIPSVIQSSKSVFESVEAEDLYYVLKGILNPSLDYLIYTALATALFKYKVEDIYGLMERGEVHSESFESIVARFSAYRSTWTDSGIFTMMTDLLKNENISETLFNRSRGERSFTNINQLIEILHDAEHKDRLSPVELVDRFAELLSNDFSGQKEYEIRLESDENLVKVMTMHKSKGLEFPVVFCQFTPKSFRSAGVVSYHNPEFNNRLIMNMDSKALSDKEKALLKQENMAEEIRLIYVALTRAKSKCYVVSGKNKNYRSSSFGYIFYESRVEESKSNASDFSEVLESLSSSSQGNINYYFYSSKKNYESLSSKGESVCVKELDCKKFSGKIDNNWRSWSYSSLSSDNHNIERDVDRYSPPVVTSINSEKEEIFSFPSGARAGECLHEVFENGDFTTGKFSSDLDIPKILGKYGFSTEWEGVVGNMFSNVVNAELPGSVRLSDVPNSSRLNELQFYIPLSGTSLNEMKDIFAMDSIYGDSIISGMKDIEQVRGLLTGFIDMVFLYQGKYYIVDWKSNILGGSSESFSEENILHEMRSHNYHLQYYLYTMALRRYLKYRLPESEFGDVFGGVYYLFIRGMASGTGRGVFHSVPEEKIIDQMDLLIKGNNDGK